MRKVGTTEYAEILFELTNGKSDADIQHAMKVFTGYLAKQKALGRVGEIQTAYERLVDSKEGRMRVVLSSTESLNPEIRADIEQAIKSVMNVSAVTLEEKTDTTLIGGWKARTEDYLIDASLKVRLNRLKMILTK